MTASPTVESSSALSRFSIFARDIKISHTVFALPWALLAAFLAATGTPSPTQILLILACMVTARTVAMASNRLLDAELDAANPRTARRALPAGLLSRSFYIAVLAACAGGFIGATALFWLIYRNPWPVALSAPVLVFISSYPMLKRFTRLCHYYLGAALGLAPVCAWLAIAGGLAATPFLIAAAVLLWTAGFDIIYGCQDYHSDVATGVVSLPAKLGIRRALRVARITHLLSFVAMILLGIESQPLGTLYFIGTACAGALLLVEHSLVAPDDLSKVGLAFFTVNGAISILIGAMGIADVFF